MLDLGHAREEKEKQLLDVSKLLVFAQRNPTRVTPDMLERATHTASALSAEIAAELVEFGVNCGPGRAATCLQEALNDLNDQGQLWPDIKEDGAIGPKTISCLKIYLLARKAAGVIVMLRDLNSRQHHHYSQLVRRRPKDERFFYGWVLTRVVY